MFEHHREPLLSLPRFFGRIAKAILVAVIIDGVALVVGAVGLRQFEGLGWVDAYLNSALMITGNGPIARAQSNAGKIFMAVYALVGVLIFAAVISVVMAPLLHRLLHAFHVAPPDGTDIS